MPATTRVPQDHFGARIPTPIAATIARSIVCIAFLGVLVAIGVHPGAAHAQACSGGAGGGMDATGNECRDGDRFVAPATSREQGLLAYERGHYAVALVHFRDAALAGDARSAEILALMHRYGPQFYGAAVPADRAASARWAAVAAERRAAAPPGSVAVRSP
jgi:hypothetical protein